MSTEIQQEGSTFSRWYARHKDEFNERRRNRYNKSKVFRAKVLRRNRLYRANATKTREKASITRELGDRAYIVFPINVAAEAIGRSAQTIRLWERDGLIPQPPFDGRNRMYTGSQIRLMTRLAWALTAQHQYWWAHRRPSESLIKATAVVLKDIKKRWETFDASDIQVAQDAGA